MDSQKTITEKLVPSILIVRFAPTRLAKGFGFIFVGEVMDRFEKQHGEAIVTIKKEFTNQLVAGKALKDGKPWNDVQNLEPMFILDWDITPV